MLSFKGKTSLLNTIKNKCWVNWSVANFVFGQGCCAKKKGFHRPSGYFKNENMAGENNGRHVRTGSRGNTAVVLSSSSCVVSGLNTHTHTPKHKHKHLISSTDVEAAKNSHIRLFHQKRSTHLCLLSAGVWLCVCVCRYNNICKLVLWARQREPTVLVDLPLNQW